MHDLIPWPFPLPEGFLDQLGYGRIVAAFNRPGIRAHLAELLRQQGTRADQTAPSGPPRGPAAARTAYLRPALPCPAALGQIFRDEP